MKLWCDFEGKCKNKPYCGVYPGMLGGKHKDRGWSYLCRKHFREEQKKYKGKLPWCLISRRKTKQLHLPKNLAKGIEKSIKTGNHKLIPLSEVMKKYGVKE